jgi:hypothetical protein
MWMILEIVIGSPVPVPPRVHQYSLSAKIEIVEAVRAYRRNIGVDAHDNALDLHKAVEIELGDIDPIWITMERTVDVRACVRDHLDLPDLKLRSVIVLRSRVQAAHPVANYRAWKVPVRHHSVFDDVTQVDMS